MPRGKKKRGAWHIKLWFADGSRYELMSHADKQFTDARMAESIRKYIVPIIEGIERRASPDGPEEAR